MKRLFRLTPALAALTALAIGGTSRADFQVEIIVDGGAFVFVPVAPLSTGGTIDISGTYGAFTINGHVDSNSNIAAASGQLNITATIIQQDADNAHIIQIVASDNNYSFPVGGSYDLRSSASGSFANTDNTDTEIYTGYAIKNPFPIFGQDVANSGIELHSNNAFPKPNGGSHSGNSNVVGFDSPSRYGLTAILNVSLGAQDPGLDPRQVLAVTSTIASARAVPEPGSIALVTVGLVGAVGVVRRNRKNAAV